ncbi:hypothetical protein AB1Y20_000827 [Prymnesium parvum]|uniref:Rhodanese domain-containing protein n=1 Tax=Prymnesium parvum TaxID=97485 RepID=A0AB34KBJ2_PRYPA
MPGGASYGAAADFNKLRDEDIRWVSAEELRRWQAAARPLLLLDVRNDPERAAGTIPGSQPFSQGKLFLDWHAMQPQIDRIVAAAAEAPAVEIVLFANTGGPNGPSAGRDLYVLNFLHEMGVPLERMARLEGGFQQWRREGYEALPPPRPPAATSLGALLEEAGLTHLAEPLAGESLEHLSEVLTASRADLLSLLKDLGLQLPDRQKVTNAISRTVKSKSTLA